MDVTITGQTWTPGTFNYNFFGEGPTFAGTQYDSYQFIGVCDGVYSDLVVNPGAAVTSADFQDCMTWGSFASAVSPSAWQSYYTTHGTPTWNWNFPWRSSTLPFHVVFYTGANRTGASYVPPYQALSLVWNLQVGHDSTLPPTPCGFEHAGNAGQGLMSISVSAADDPTKWSHTSSPNWHQILCNMQCFDGPDGTFTNGAPGVDCFRTKTLFMSNPSELVAFPWQQTGSLTITGHN